MLKVKNELPIVLEFKKKSNFKRYLFLVFIAFVFAILLNCIVNRQAETMEIGFGFVGTCWIYHIYFNKLNSGKIEIHTDSFIINNGNQKKVIPYNQIKNISSRYYLNGDEGDFTIQLHNNKKIRISVLLLQANLLIDGIYNKTNAISKEEYEKINKYIFLPTINSIDFWTN